MTKHLPDEAISKEHLQLESAEKIISGSLALLDNGELSVSSCDSRSRIAFLHATKTKNGVTQTSTQLCLPKPRTEKSMVKLYNLEKDDVSEKKLNINLDIDLYQMENY